MLGRSRMLCPCVQNDDRNGESRFRRRGRFGSGKEEDEEKSCLASEYVEEEEDRDMSEYE